MAQAPIIVIGSRGHARVVIDSLHQMGRKILFATDSDATQHQKDILGIEVKGTDELLWKQKPGTVAVALGLSLPGGSIEKASAIRADIVQRISAAGFEFVTLVHPSAVVGTEVILGEGCQIMAGTVVQPSCKIGPHAVVNTGATVDHECVIGRNAVIAPGVTLGGNVIVGDNAFIGLGAVVGPGIQIGAGAVIAAGAVVLENVEPSQRVAGIPARPF